ncbi:MAG: pullulanase-type alpha-1,6-glucosidase, partial [Chloroflexi bacterium]|nr:pullulanase-type alpha-1,6-glucosidase [Chloroflexota bacterium]
VYAPTTQAIEVNAVTDPYSLSLATNSTRSQIVDLLNDSALMPEGWTDMAKPTLEAPEDIVLYELHIRDFSMNDMTVPEDLRGTYLAFTVSDSDGMNHLRALADAGLTHVHLLPTFDIATVNEDKSTWVLPDWDELAGFAPDSEEQQAIIVPNSDLDAFNWGYDPFHYTVPEGSYATSPDGVDRIIEFRRMVMGLNDANLRVVMDVVYNHTNSSGQNPNSVLDKIVPGYYHRLNDIGGVETSTCCQNTATENNMMEKLMIDSVLMWSRAYRVDGYRFDLMGHHMVSNMANLRTALDGLTLEADGVDGTSIYVYGEGWNFGEVENGARGPNATQLNIGGLGIGSFNDRIRDRVRGGNPFDDRRLQGFITGLYYDPSEFTTDPLDTQLDNLLHFTDTIRVGLAGNLRDYEFVDRNGDLVTGADIDYNGSPAGYTLDPQEHISYVSAHDNETLFDKIQFAAPLDATMAERVRMHNMGISIVALSQGVPFFHAGSEMLRSKDMDRDSYNSGDWFNRLDFTYQTNNWGVGLPPAGPNQERWEIMRIRLADPALAPEPDDILLTVNHTQEMLSIRSSSRLFRLETAADIQERVVFHNTGPDQIPALIVMSISDMTDVDLDPNTEFIVVLFNAGDEDITFTQPDLIDLALELHPIQISSYDTVVQTAAFDAESGTFSIPARTTAVFVLPEAPAVDTTAIMTELEADYLEITAAYDTIAAVWNGLDAGEAVVCGEYPELPAVRTISAEGAADLEPLAAALGSAAIDTEKAVELWQIECLTDSEAVSPGVISQGLMFLADAEVSLAEAEGLMSAE